jgi:hypothetical protein
MLAGSVAAFMATLAYAGLGRQVETADARGGLIAVIDGPVGSGPALGAPSVAASEPGASEPVSPAEPPTTGSSHEPASRHQVGDKSATAALPGGLAAPSGPAGAAGAARRGGAPGPLGSESFDSAPAHDGVRTVPSVTTPHRHERGGAIVGRDDTSWRAVSDALALGKQWRAEQLLTRLAERGVDANTRAKAKLGLGQLEASRGRCTKARQLALAVASQEGIETKTARRALELAARCLR